MAQEINNVAKESNDKAGKEETAQENQISDEYLLDMVFVLDCTGSMASYINSARDNIVKISQELSKLSEKKSNDTSSNENDKSMCKDEKEKEKEKENENDKIVQENDKPENIEQIEGMVDTAINESAQEKENDNNNNESNESAKNKENDNNESKEEKKEKEAPANPEPKKKLSCKFAVVAYRDHPPQDSSFITQIRDFTGSSIMIKQYLSTLSANGGGDGPECLTTALYDTLNNLKYRENSQRIIIVITDAPCHGLEDRNTSGDGFPNGDPWPKWKFLSNQNNINNKNRGINRNKFIGVRTRDSKSGEYKTKDEMPDILTIVRDITDNLQASFYTVACEPCLSTSYDYARDLMEAMAEMSNGKYLPLTKANLLPKVIIGSVKQQMLIDELTEKIDIEIEELKEEYKNNNKELTQDIITEFMEKKWENADITYKEVGIGKLYRKERERTNIEILLNRQECKTLKDFEKKRVKLDRLTYNDFRHLKTSSSSSSGSGRVPYSRSITSELESGIMECATLDFDDSSHRHITLDKKSSAGFSFGSMFGGFGSFFSRSSDVSDKSKTISVSKSKTILESAPAPAMKRKPAKKKNKKSFKNKDDSDDDMALSTRYDINNDDDDANLSCSEDEQDVYEEVRTMDSKGVKKAVSRYMQTYY